jgi:hypothetical protein
MLCLLKITNARISHKPGALLCQISPIRLRPGLHTMSSECAGHCCLTISYVETCSNFQGKALNHHHSVQLKYCSRNQEFAFIM